MSFLYVNDLIEPLSRLHLAMQSENPMLGWPYKMNVTYSGFSVIFLHGWTDGLSYSLEFDKRLVHENLMAIEYWKIRDCCKNLLSQVIEIKNCERYPASDNQIFRNDTALVLPDEVIGMIYSCIKYHTLEFS